MMPVQQDKHDKRFRRVTESASTPSNYTFLWKNLLEEALVKSENSDCRCSDYVVPVDAFYQAPLVELMRCVDTNVEVEVKLRGDYSSGTDDALFKEPLYWFARVMKVVGYRLLLRYEGMDRDGDDVRDFWVNIASTEIERVGYCSEEQAGTLIPPESIVDRHNDWKDYAFCRIHAFRTLPTNWNEYRQKNITRCKFKKGDRVELLDSLVSMRVRPALIEDILGDRVWVKLSENDLTEPSIASGSGDEEDPQVSGVWMDQDSPLLFHVGWSSRVGYTIEASKEFIKHAEAVAAAMNSNNEILPLAPHDAHPDLFKLYKENERMEDTDVLVEWEKGMKLEVLDPLDTWKELRVATVLELLGDGFLKIGFDGGDMVEDTVPIHCSSPLLFPVGYAKKYGIELKHPGENRFDWPAYLRECNAVGAPEELFECIERLEGIERFRVGAKLEAVDLCEPALICVATVAAHKGRLLRIKYDGWDDSFDQLFDFRSNNLYPVGWCEMYGHTLQAPKVEVKKKKSKK